MKDSSSGNASAETKVSSANAKAALEEERVWSDNSACSQNKNMMSRRFTSATVLDQAISGRCASQMAVKHRFSQMNELPPIEKRTSHVASGSQCLNL
mmetsp:Transcript_34726/g.53308  ORF Transcript_34726/g.53308 Transcript_34726/m.53308 type:complete len:97 (-) Transcript_34726:19-309(-)